MSVLKKSVLIIFCILAVDQAVKIAVKTTMKQNDYYDVFCSTYHSSGYYKSPDVEKCDGWLKIIFLENDGMAFGLDIPGTYGKIALSLFRIIAVIFMGIFLFRQSRKDTHTGLIVCVSMILAGAAGNIIDSAFYGLIFGSSFGQVAEFLPEGGGYGTFLHGSVVDMFKLDVPFTWPEWIPLIGGEEFFPPVFNIADISITAGIVILILFQGKFFRQHHSNITPEAPKSDDIRSTVKVNNRDNELNI